MVRRVVEGGTKSVYKVSKETGICRMLDSSSGRDCPRLTERCPVNYGLLSRISPEILH